MWGPGFFGGGSSFSQSYFIGHSQNYILISFFDFNLYVTANYFSIVLECVLLDRLVQRTD